MADTPIYIGGIIVVGVALRWDSWRADTPIRPYIIDGIIVGIGGGALGFMMDTPIRRYVVGASLAAMFRLTFGAGVEFIATIAVNACHRIVSV